MTYAFSFNNSILFPNPCFGAARGCRETGEQTAKELAADNTTAILQ
jgi:hypothetical protein